jgi:Zn-finger nucleic acid-binding protein
VTHPFEKPSSQEDEYFAREEIEQKHRLAVHQAEELATRQKEQLRLLHFMKCPHCGMDLHALKRGVVDVDMCFHCQGIWLDKGRLEALLDRPAHESGAVMRAILNIFRSAPRTESP